MTTSSGPFIFKIGDRYAVTTKRLQPHNLGYQEHIRCGIAFDTKDFNTALQVATRKKRART